MILDYIGGDYISKNLNLLKNDGSLINIGFQKGSKVELNLIKVMLKRLVITGSTLRIRESSFKGKILEELQKNVFPNFDNRIIKCYIDSVFKLEDVVERMKRLNFDKEGKAIQEAMEKGDEYLL